MKKWIFPCNLEKYDVLTAFAEKGCIDWRKRVSAEIGDEVYIYSGGEVKSILLKTEVIGINCEDLIGDIKYQRGLYKGENELNYLRLKIRKSFLGDKQKYLSYSKLLENGLNGAIQGQLSLTNNPKLEEYINLVEL